MQDKKVVEKSFDKWLTDLEADKDLFEQIRESDEYCQGVIDMLEKAHSNGYCAGYIEGYNVGVSETVEKILSKGKS